tara:strand:- start:3185 stop:4231 length:1047 start_codon:yes stop_codon:yes gene_type:complete
MTINDNYNIVFLTKSDFNSNNLNNKLKNDDLIFHFAGVNRDINDTILYEKNELINNTLLIALEKVNFSGKLYFTSSTQETINTKYGIAKKNARLRFLNQSKKLGYVFHGLILPNLFGPFCKPNYNSFIATFCFNLINSKKNEINDDKNISLMYVNDLVTRLIDSIKTHDEINLTEIITQRKVSDILILLEMFNETYIKKGNYPNLNSHFNISLFNTFMSYVNLNEFFPKKYIVHKDNRGSFTELIRSYSKGQTSFSTTKKNVVRGNHYHTRKIERFSVISGKAKIEIREILSDNIISYVLDGNTPSYIDMPIWYTHNIKNIGSDDLLTMFWVNEHYEDNDSDTYKEKV